MGAVVSQGGTNTHRVVPGSSDETHQQSEVDVEGTTDEDEVQADINVGLYVLNC
jgi:hypothetical protein